MGKQINKVVLLLSPKREEKRREEKKSKEKNNVIDFLLKTLAVYQDPWRTTVWAASFLGFVTIVQKMFF